MEKKLKPKLPRKKQQPTSQVTIDESPTTSHVIIPPSHHQSALRHVAAGSAPKVPQLLLPLSLKCSPQVLTMQQKFDPITHSQHHERCCHHQSQRIQARQVQRP
jgi:hypothetical protein